MAAGYTFTGPGSGFVNSASTAFTVTPVASYTGNIVVTPSGGGLSTPTTLTYSGSAAPQTFTITPTASGTVVLTPTNSTTLSNAGALSYVASYSSPSLDPVVIHHEKVKTKGRSGSRLVRVNVGRK